MKILGQKLLNVSIKNGGARIWIEDKRLNEVNFAPGTQFSAEIIKEDNRIVLKPHESGNKVSSRQRKGNTIPIIDKSGEDIRETLAHCAHITVTFIHDETYGDRVVIQGIKDTATVLKENIEKEPPLTSISFCAGAGISSDCLVRAGFKELAACEWNPASKEGGDDKFASIYLENHKSVMFNIPMQQLDANALPPAIVWSATLDCSDFSKLASGKTEYHTMHLFVHLMRLFYQLPKEKRPKAILIENTELFEHIAGNSVKLCLEEEGYEVTMGKLNSLDYGSRTKRERFFLVASIFNGFQFPEPTGRQNTPISDDNIITVDTLNWVTPEENGTLKYFVERNNHITHNHKITTFDITKDSYIGTIPKSHHKYLPENLIRHPQDPHKFAFLRDTNHLRYLHGIRPSLYLGDSTKKIIESIGQGVCCHTFDAIAQKLFVFLNKMLTSNEALVGEC